MAEAPKPRPTRQLKSRADLMSRGLWADLQTDSAGNPCVWLMTYAADDGGEYQDAWSCQVDDDGRAPISAEWIGPTDQTEVELWEALPDAW